MDKKIRLYTRQALAFVARNKLQLIPIALIIIWCWPYFTTGSKQEWGDFSFFAQAHEAMRISVVDYGQFPWFNPWVSGGVPLYANPQMGFFSIQMLLTFIFGAPLALKLTVVIFTLGGYAAMLLLTRRYFKIEPYLATLISLLWIFCSFFVSHLPAHFTFIWYMLAPLYIFLALTIKSWKGGLLFGGAFAIMALSQIHNAFMHIMLICGVILLIRLIIERKKWRPLVTSMLAAAGVFVVFAGHRFLLTYQNVHDFPRFIADPTPNPFAALLGPILPLSMAHPIKIFNYPKPPYVAHGFHETTATIGLGALIVALFLVMFLIYQLYSNRQKIKSVLIKWRLPLVVFAIAMLCLSIALGSVLPIAPYSLLKHLPVFSDMRVSTRWFLWFDLALLIFIGLMVQKLPKASFMRFTSMALLTIGVIELFALNAGYQANILVHQPVDAPKNIKEYQFAQTAYFGQTRQLPNGDVIPYDGSMPDGYREYEATKYNLGVLYANDALVQLHLDPKRNPGHPTCPVEEGCGFVHTKNAKVASWSPNKIVLERTGPGEIKLNMNNSNYFLINGQRNTSLKVAEPFVDFTINEPDEVKIITIEASPSIIKAVKDLL